jgi:hypothetical protein
MRHMRAGGDNREVLTDVGFGGVEAQHADAAVAILRARAAKIHARKHGWFNEWSGAGSSVPA